VTEIKVYLPPAIAASAVLCHVDEEPEEGETFRESVLLGHFVGADNQKTGFSIDTA
jgi:hypothetical protein